MVKRYKPPVESGDVTATYDGSHHTGSYEVIGNYDAVEVTYYDREGIPRRKRMALDQGRLSLERYKRWLMRELVTEFGPKSDLT